MRRTAAFPALLMALCLAANALADSTTDPAIDRWIERHVEKLQGVEQGGTRYAVVGDLDGDGMEDVAVLYTIDGAKPANSPLRYLAVFRRARDALAYQTHALVGGLGIREVNRATILKRTIDLETLEYQPRDGLCCPSRYAKRRYQMRGHKLVQIDDSAKSRPILR